MKSARTDIQKKSIRTESLKRLSDDDLIKQLLKTRGDERAVQLEILKYLNEVDRRRLYIPRGYRSLFEFCTGYLKYSNSSAGRRIGAARCIRQFPHVEKMFLAGELDLTVVARIARVLTKENAAEILAWIKGKPFRDVEIFVSRHEPGRFMRDMVKPVIFMTESGGAGTTPGNEGGANAHSASGTVGNADKISPSGTPERCKASFTFTPNVGSKSTQHLDNKSDKNRISAAYEEPETAERVLIDEKFKIQFTVDPTFMEKLAKVRSLLSTKYPKKITFEFIFDILMTEYLDRHSPEERIKRRNARGERKEKKRFNNKDNPGTRNKKSIRKTRRKITKRTRHIPQAVRDEVFKRDGGRCTFIGPDGKRCNSSWNLQIDHIVPFAKGGDNSPENLRLLCAEHNHLAAERAYGKNHIDKFAGERNLYSAP
jgi:5-methylcytosine-specific restriction endonuclease McrA